MENNIYEWLAINTLEDSQISKTTTLIECVLVLSINGVYISYKHLIEYCNNRLNNSNNGNNKGLDDNQFEILNNNIKSLNDIYNNTSSSSSSSPSNTKNNKIKFNYSIYLITENNNNHYIKYDSNYNSSSSSSNNNQIVIKRSNRSNSICSCGSNGNGSTGIVGDINKSFFKVWRNIVILNEILFHTRLYNIHLNVLVHFFHDELLTYKYRSYLNKILIAEQFATTILKSNSLSSSITEIMVVDPNIQFELNSIPDSVTSLEIREFKSDQLFIKGILPDSITHLDIWEDSGFNQSLSGNWLPANLKTLKLSSRSFDQIIEPNQLPNSLTELEFYEGMYGYKGVILPSSIPKSVKSLNFKVGNNHDTDRLFIPKATTNLEFGKYDKILEQGDIPENVTSLKFKYGFNCELNVGVLPVSLKSLGFSTDYDKVINDNVLPVNLTSINMGGYENELTPNLFPQSITSIKFNFYSLPLPVGYFYNYSNLKSLEFNFFDYEIPQDTLPRSLTSLILGEHYNCTINPLVFPLSLTTLKLKNETIKIDGQLPSSITSLSINVHSIEPNLLPINLVELHLNYHSFNQDLSIDNCILLPSTLQHIYISNENLDFINSLNMEFLFKYIKFDN